MGQATMNLPDPVQNAPAPLTSADDLLSQLAGQEIDRLLADADTSLEEAPADDSAPPQESATAELEELINSERSKDEPAPASVATPEKKNDPADLADRTSASADEECAEQIDELFKQLDLKPGTAPEPAPEPTGVSVVAAPIEALVEKSVEARIEPQRAAPAPAPSRIESDEQTTSAERAALTAAIPAVTRVAPAAPAATSPTPAQIDDRLPLLVRALELLNLPFSTCSDFLRDILGKIAILTLMNAIGVFLYVILFRR